MSSCETLVILQKVTTNMGRRGYWTYLSTSCGVLISDGGIPGRTFRGLKRDEDLSCNFRTKDQFELSSNLPKRFLFRSFYIKGYLVFFMTCWSCIRWLPGIKKEKLCLFKGKKIEVLESNFLLSSVLLCGNNFWFLSYIVSQQVPVV